MCRRTLSGPRVLGCVSPVDLRSRLSPPMLHVTSSITCTAVLDAPRATAEHLAKLLRGHRERLGTRKGIRALGVFEQAVLLLRWFVDVPGWSDSPKTTASRYRPPTATCTKG